MCILLACNAREGGLAVGKSFPPNICRLIGRYWYLGLGLGLQKYT